MPPAPALDSGIESGDDDFKKADRLAARAARFSQKLPGNKYKELEEARTKERKVFEDQGLIKVGKTELDDAVDMRGSCERMCSDYEREFREYTREIHPFEAAPNKRMDPAKAVAAYSRSDAGAGHGDSAILPSDLRTPQTLVRTLDYLFSQIMPTQSPELVGPPTARKALGYTAGFIRDRTRAIRKEFAMQSSWGQEEAISSFERIARWHVLCLRELQEETGMNSDMHIDSAELGRCFTSLRQHYNDRREELGVDLPCANEPEFQAYMLIFNLADKSVAIPTSELPSVILDSPLVQLAWEIRRTAQRNFDIQKEGSKSNAEYGANMINLFVRLLRQPKVPYLLACLVEVRLREMRRSALRALIRTYPRLRADPLRYNDQGEVVERRMLLIQTLDRILGCEEQDDEGSAYDDVEPVNKDADHEAIDTVQKFQLEVYPNPAEAMGALINLGVAYNDNRDAPYTRRWRLITEKRSNLSFVDVVNGTAGVQVDGTAAPKAQIAPRRPALPPVAAPKPSFPTLTKPTPVVQEVKPKTSAFSFGVPPAPPTQLASPSSSKPDKVDLPFSFGPKPSIQVTPTASPVNPLVPQAKQPAFTFSPPPPAPPPTQQSIPAAVEPPPSSFNAFPPLGKAPASHPVPSPPTQTLATPTTPPAPPSAKALGKRPAVPRPIPPRISENDRRRNHRAAPALKDEMILDFLRDTLSDMTVDLLKMVKQEDAARQYHLASDQRHKAIGTWSIWVYEAIQTQMIERIARKAVLKELKRRYLSRKYFKLWQTWTRRHKAEQRNSIRDRRQVFADFGRMGLGGGDMTLSEAGEGPAARAVSEIRDEFQADVSLRESASERAHLFASTTFLHIIARHIAPLLAAPPVDPLAALSSPLSTISGKSNALYEWETILSPAKDATSAPPPEASDWLRSKLLPRDETFYEYSDVLLDTSVVGRYDDLPVARAVGLIIFEAPLKADDGGIDPGDIADAQDRLLALSRMSQDQTNRYDPVLLILTWQEETTEELVTRLDIRSQLDLFPRRAVMCLSNVDSVDSLLETTLKDLIPAVAPKRQVIIRLRDLLGRVIPIWRNYISTTRLLLRERPNDGKLALSTFQNGLEAMNEVSAVAQKSLGHVRLSETGSFIPITFPPFERPLASSSQDAVEAIAAYLSRDELSGVDEVNLLLGPLTRAASTNSVLPITEILSSLSSLVFGELSNQIIPLDSFWPAEVAEEVVHGYMMTASTSYEKFINTRLEELGQMLVPLDSLYQNLSNGESAENGMPSTARTSSKRGRMSSSENLRVSPSAKQVKASKNARLLDVMADVKRTLGEMNVDAVF